MFYTAVGEEVTGLYTPNPRDLEDQWRADDQFLDEISWERDAIV
jgi:hypothetical protein